MGERRRAWDGQHELERECETYRDNEADVDRDTFVGTDTDKDTDCER